MGEVNLSKSAFNLRPSIVQTNDSNSDSMMSQGQHDMYNPRSPLDISSSVDGSVERRFSED